MIARASDRRRGSRRQPEPELILIRGSTEHDPDDQRHLADFAEAMYRLGLEASHHQTGALSHAGSQPE
jgi:hypothetical protein